MAFRDDELAGRARIEALERELQSLREENDALRSRSQPVSRPPRKLSGFALILLSLALIAIGMAVLAGWSIPSYGDDLGIALFSTAVVLLAMASALAVLGRLLIIVPPDRVVILSGRDVPGPDGTMRGYRVVHGGRVLRLPLIEQRDDLDVTPMKVDAWVHNAYTRGNRPVDVHFRAMARIAREEPRVHHAIERFLGRDRREVVTVARETLEGAMRGVVAQLTIEQLREDGLRVAEELIREAEGDYQRLGLELETLHVLEVETRSE